MEGLEAGSETSEGEEHTVEKILMSGCESTKEGLPTSPIKSSDSPLTTSNPTIAKRKNQKFESELRERKTISTDPKDALEFLRGVFTSIQNDPDALSRMEDSRPKASPAPSKVIPPPSNQPLSTKLDLCRLTTSLQSKPDSKRSGPHELIHDNRVVSCISGGVTQWVDFVTFHYTDGSRSTFAPCGIFPQDLEGAARFPLHAEEAVVAVTYKHKRAAINLHVLGCGIEFETSFGRTFLLCGRPDSCFSWASGGDKAVWRAGQGSCIVGLCLGKVERGGAGGRDW